jgi:hypothetical protein
MWSKPILISTSHIFCFFLFFSSKASLLLTNFTLDSFFLFLVIGLLFATNTYSLLLLTILSELCWLSFFFFLHTFLLYFALLFFLYIFMFFLSIATLDLAYALTLLFTCGKIGGSLQLTENSFSLNKNIKSFKLNF